MIVAKRKPFEELKAMLKDYKKVLNVGCGTCVAVCLAGGEKEVDVLNAELDMARKLDDNPVELGAYTVERQCDREYLEELDDKVGDYDAIISMACGVGIQFLAEHHGKTPIYPGLNTTFIGVAEAQGVWSERCQACGDCVLALTGGLCPIARCAKSLLNGPCGGSTAGKCEINQEIECAWQLIVDRLNALDRMDEYETLCPIKDWSTERAGGPRKVVREDVQQ